MVLESDVDGSHGCRRISYSMKISRYCWGYFVVKTGNKEMQIKYKAKMQQYIQQGKEGSDGGKMHMFGCRRETSEQTLQARLWTLTSSNALLPKTKTSAGTSDIIDLVKKECKNLDETSTDEDHSKVTGQEGRFASFRLLHHSAEMPLEICRVDQAPQTDHKV